MTLLMGLPVDAQDRPYRRYATQEVEQRLGLSTREALRGAEEAGKKLKYKKISVAVVFHILQSPGQAVVSEQQVYQQLAILNQDFDRDKEQKHPADILEKFADRSAKMEVSFCLPQTDPMGEVTTAIQALAVDSVAWSTQDNLKYAETGGADAWDPDQYINVWVVSLAGGVSGYAQGPGGPRATDGIVIDYRYFGVGDSTRLPYAEGKTLTHLMGSYLGLQELWNEKERCADDGIDDTPIHNAPNYALAGYKHRSLCPGNPVEMTMNFMDNTDDEYQYMFTAGQKAVMQWVLSEEGLRSGLSATKTKCKQTVAGLLLSVGSTAEGIHLFPNPATAQVEVRLFQEEAEGGKLRVYSALGRLEWEQETQAVAGFQQWRLDTSHWPPGTYLIQWQRGASHEERQLIILHD